MVVARGPICLNGRAGKYGGATGQTAEASCTACGSVQQDHHLAAALFSNSSGTTHFFYLFISFLAGVDFFEKKMEKNCVFSLFFLSSSLYFFLSLYTQVGFFLV
jgi:hypothetical protein